LPGISERIREHALKVVNTDDPHSLAGRARAKRFTEFNRRFPQLAEMRVLDLGGTPRFWRAAPVKPAHVTIVNLIPEVSDEPWIDSRPGDIFNLSAGEQFELVVSNSVIEHLGGHEQRRRFAEIVEAHAPRHWVQTPNYYFPVEPHWLFPGMQFLPTSGRVAVAKHWKLGHIRARSLAEAKREVAEVELLTRKMLAGYFPSSEIWDERLAGMAKSITAIKE
jgi:hypothetical protein